ncbi:hypothetical protein ACFPRL_30675 [Pseudoclavibacter helvolus]
MQRGQGEHEVCERHDQQGAKRQEFERGGAPVVTQHPGSPWVHGWSPPGFPGGRGDR